MMSIHLTAAGKAVLRNGKFDLTTPATVAADNGTVTLTEAMADTIYQRVGTAKAVPISLTVTGADGPVEMRVVSAKTGAVIVDWTVVGTTAGGALSGALTVPQGGIWYKWQARKVSNPSIITTGTRQFGVGKRIALIGQSNMAHMWEGEATYPLSDSRARRFSGGKWGYVGAADPTGTWAPGTPAFSGGGVTGYAGDSTVNNSVNGYRGDGIVALVNAMTASLDILVGTFEYAVGGTSIEQWQTGGNCWGPFAAAVTAAGGDFEEAIWYQGESNAGGDVAAYTTKLGNVLSQCRTLSGRNASTFAFGVVTLGPCDGAGGFANFAPMRAAQIAFIANNPGTYLAGVAGDSSVPSNDAVHLDNASRVRMGKRYSKASKAYASGTPKPGPHITGATRSGAVITVAISGGTGALNDGNGGSGAALKGFRAFDNGVAATISTTTISGSSVIITLAAAPAGAVTLDYGMADLPYGAYTPPAGSVLYDSDTVPDTTLGLPLQPCAPTTVTGS